MRKEASIPLTVICILFLSLLYGCMSYEEEFAGEAYLKLQKNKQQEYKDCFTSECSSFTPKSLEHRACLKSCVDDVKGVPLSDRDVVVDVVSEEESELEPNPDTATPDLRPLIEQIVLNDDELPEGYILNPAEDYPADIKNPGYVIEKYHTELLNRGDIEGIEDVFLASYLNPGLTYSELIIMGVRFSSDSMLETQKIKLLSNAINQEAERFTFFKKGNLLIEIGADIGRRTDAAEQISESLRKRLDLEPVPIESDECEQLGGECQMSCDAGTESKGPLNCEGGLSADCCVPMTEETGTPETDDEPEETPLTTPGCCYGVVGCSSAYYASECSTLAAFVPQKCEELEECDIVACCHETTGLPSSMYRATCEGISSRPDMYKIQSYQTDSYELSEAAGDMCEILQTIDEGCDLSSGCNPYDFVSADSINCGMFGTDAAEKCFSDALGDCEPAYIVSVLMGTTVMSVDRQIGSECEITAQYLEQPYPNFEDTYMTCTVPIAGLTYDRLTDEYLGSALYCTGSFMDAVAAMG